MQDLAKAEWTKRDDLPALVAALGADNMRWVGGAVRDGLLGVPVADVDAATKLHPQEVVAQLDAAGIKSIPTGIEHGTVTAIMPLGPVEVTTLRRDVATDGRRATIAFATEWREDAARRDFTINALFAHPETLEIADYFGGRDDLSAGRVRFIGDARQRIAEDHLRILRYYRFQARFGSALDEEAEEACADLAATMKGLSRERVASELMALLRLPDPAETTARMRERGVLRVILPEAGADELARLRTTIAAEQQFTIAPDPVRRLSALLPQDAGVAKQVAAKLRLSNAVKKRLALSAKPYGGEKPRALAHAVGIEPATDVLLKAGESPASLQGWEKPRLPIGGGEIVARGIAAGPDVSRILQAVERRWVAEGFPDRARVIALLDEQLAAEPGQPGS
ncbi:CCA tRNA nucleotidyltransferase [Paraurantiacibacter namhicola]|uniref:CCA-adding enzyme n=1 Tax=Paraurantiacibacter namhicola TaxID=645517 RepID=A0A1C7D852_9SPHN|nr:CCA tRNA nucleotidyltransferase [Paraurantiacibacter namhicola]ANU07501.1 CCA-adding enzyme [Paraurantiacibacter namhicola]